MHRAACEPDYSACLAAIDAPPPVIFMRGRRELLNRPAIAMVGARDASAVRRGIWRRNCAGRGFRGLFITCKFLPPTGGGGGVTFTRIDIPGCGPQLPAASSPQPP